MKLSKNWWEADTYTGEESIPDDIAAAAGPQGVALVRVYPAGNTSEGWGLTGKDGKPGFMYLYEHKEFLDRRVLYGYDRGKWAFAFVMRSVNMIVIDIDGKNGGLEHASELLGNAAPTLAETSKSGNGYHLFYTLDEDWDPATGFGDFADVIGIVQGVDIRATGCVYHHPQQRWNGRPAVPLPEHIAERLRARAQRRAATSAASAAITSLDPMEKLMAHAELIAELAKPIAAGKRNNTLFAIGSQLKDAEVPDWESLVEQRALQVGLDMNEADKLVRNIFAYNA